MTVEEAIRYAGGLNFCASCTKSFECIEHNGARVICDKCEHMDFFAVAIEALEKQIPKKPKPGRRFGEVYVTCPVCGSSCGTRDFCPNCGQAIDWS